MRELRRILLNKGTAFILALLTLIGCFLFTMAEKQDSKTKDYDKIYTKIYREMIEEYKELEPEYALELLTEKNEELMIGSFGDDARAEIEACEKLMQQISHLAWFNNYYPSIVESAERLQHTQLFGSIGGFNYENTLQTVKDFAAIEGAVGELGDDRGLSRIFSDSMTDYLILIFIAYICISLLQERKSGLWHLVRSLPRGRSQLAVSRIIALFICSFISVLFIFYSRAAISYALYDGFAYGDRLVQSVEGFSGITFPISINNFLILYGLVKALCTFVASLLIWLLLSSCKNINISLGITALTLAAEYAFYATISDNSILVPFKYFNIFQIIEPSEFVTHYLNLNIGGVLINIRMALTVFITLVSAFALTGCVLLQCYKKPGGMANPIEFLIDRIRRLTYRCVFLQEVWKILVPQKGFVIIIMMIFLACSFGELPDTSATAAQRRLRSYYEEYAGSVDETTLESIDAEIERLNAEIDEATDPNWSYSLNRLIESLEGFKQEVKDIIRRNESGEYPNEILLTPPYTYLGIFGQNAYDMQVSQGLKATFMICLLSCGLFAYERQSSMGKLLKSLPRGGVKLIIRKEVILLAFSALVFAAVYLPEIIAAADESYYGGFQYFNYPIQGLQALRDWRIGISVGTFTIGVYVLRFLVIFIVGSLAALIGALAKKVNTAAILATAILVAPECLVAMGINSIYPFTALTGLGITHYLF